MLLIYSCFALLTQILIAIEISHTFPVEASDSQPSTSGQNRSASSDNSNDLIYLKIENNEQSDISKVDRPTTSSPTVETDMDDFIELIPSQEAQTIVARYYRTDREVLRAYTYLQSNDFAKLKERTLNIPEVNNFLRYLNQTGLDFVRLMNTLANILGGDPFNHDGTNRRTHQQENHKNGGETSTLASLPLASGRGLHGLVDDVLDILPQDQILSLFFEKLETNTEFSNFVHNVGSEEFSDILQDMEDSTELRTLVYTLHNNGIYIGRIVDSLKGYFFLGTFS